MAPAGLHPAQLRRARRFRCTPTGCGSRRWASPPSSPRACRSRAGSSSDSPPSSSSSSSSTCRWPPGPPRRTSCGSSRISSGCPDARSWSRSSGGCSCRSSRSSRSSRGPARSARGPPCSSTSTGPRSTRRIRCSAATSGSTSSSCRSGGSSTRGPPRWWPGRSSWWPRSTCCSGASCSPRAGRASPREPGRTCWASPPSCSCSAASASGSTASTCSTRPAAWCSAPPTPTCTPPCPVLQWLIVLAVLCAAACVFQMFRPGWRFLVAGLVVLVVLWVAGLGIAPALLQSYRVKPNELVYERPYIENNIRMTRQAYALDRVAEKDFAAEDNLTPAALERNNLTIKNIRLWDHRPLLTTYGKLQEIRTYYKFRDVDVGPLHAERRVPPGDAVRARALLPRPAEPGLDQRAPDLHPRLRAGGGAGQPDQPGGAARVLRQGHSARGDGRHAEDHAARDLLRRDRQRVRVRAHALAGAGLPLGRPERLHALRGTGRHPGQHAASARRPSRRASAPSTCCCRTTSRPRAG